MKQWAIASLIFLSSTTQASQSAHSFSCRLSPETQKKLKGPEGKQKLGLITQLSGSYTEFPDDIEEVKIEFLICSSNSCVVSVGQKMLFSRYEKLENNKIEFGSMSVPVLNQKYPKPHLFGNFVLNKTTGELKYTILTTQIKDQKFQTVSLKSYSYLCKID
ncbi:MAG: hypothetical protein CL678_10520 [Bdellovibrionaceae bacterium]|nr:hypothetical protein [Pseudobdellovibrionaceae bacterium]|tara:strand:- start:5813 stop:6295 length:483 start_codon:yes stop_codon:yes gene_type:complete